MDAACLFLGGILALTASHIETVRDQAATLQRIGQLGGRYLYDFQVVDRRNSSSTRTQNRRCPCSYSVISAAICFTRSG